MIQLNSEFCTLTLIAGSNQPRWFYIIKKCLAEGKSREVLSVYNQIRRNRFCVLDLVHMVFKACASSSNLIYGKSLHSEVLKTAVHFDVKVGTSMLDMYAKCGCIVDAGKVFDEMPMRNVVTLNAMIGGHLKIGDMKSALDLFGKMSTRTPVTWIEMINGFARSGDIVKARGFFDMVPSSLRNVVTWTAIIDGYASNGEMEAARELFEKMPERNFYVWSSMISGYCKRGEVNVARAIFDCIPSPNVVNWNALISGYAQNGFCQEALEAYWKMQDEGFEPDEFTISSVLSACAQLGELETGKQIHCFVNEKRLELNRFVLNGLVDMYAKCGDLNNARLIFEGMTHRSCACWNSMISGFAIHGQSEEALQFFKRMEKSNEKPDDITFLTLLSALVHAGFVDEGLEVFSKMEKYGVVASVKHYGCLVDLLGRAGRLKEAFELIKSMPVKPNDVVWGALLGACRIHSDMDMVELVMQEVVKVHGTMDSGDDLHYVLLSNIYAASDRWEKAETMRVAMTNKGFQKTPGSSAVILDSTEQ